LQNSGGFAAFSVCRDDACQLTGRGLQHARDLGRRRLQQSDELAAQLIE